MSTIDFITGFRSCVDDKRTQKIRSDSKPKSSCIRQKWLRLRCYCRLSETG